MGTYVLLTRRKGEEVIELTSLKPRLVFFILFYPLHPHAANPKSIPGVPVRFQKPIRQLIFFIMGTASGCYLIHITNSYGYLAVMKRAPPLGCLWVWSVVELELVWAALSLLGTGVFLWLGGYNIK